MAFRETLSTLRMLTRGGRFADTSPGDPVIARVCTMTTHKSCSKSASRRWLTPALITLAMTAAPTRGFSAEPRPMPRIPSGTRFDTTPPEGWSNIVLFVEGRVASGDLSAASSTVRQYSKMFNLVMLADVAKDDEGVHRLTKVGIGFSTKIDGHNTVITVNTEEELGAGLGFIATSVFKANEASLSEIKQVERSKNCVLFDAPTIMLYKDEHETMMVRYLIWASPRSGHVSTFVWLMDYPADDSAYRTMEPTFQMLPENMREDRVMNVKADRFTFGIPAKDAFALVRIPQGRAISFTPRLSKVAGLRSYDEATFTELLQAITDAVKQSGTRRNL